MPPQQSSCANCITVGRDCLFVGCADGVVRCFSPSTLNFLATLPRPHPLGLDLATAGVAPPPPVVGGGGARHPHTVALALDEVHRRLTCVYNDHSLFVWDVGDLKRIGKCHSYLFHSACIWGIEVGWHRPEGEGVGGCVTQHGDTYRGPQSQ